MFHFLDKQACPGIKKTCTCTVLIAVSIIVETHESKDFLVRFSPANEANNGGNFVFTDEQATESEKSVCNSSLVIGRIICRRAPVLKGREEECRLTF